MGWKFWQREPTAAEQSLIDLERGAASTVTPGTPTPAPTAPAVTTSRRTAGGRRIITRTTTSTRVVTPIDSPEGREALQALLGKRAQVRVSLGGEATFTMRVASVTADGDDLVLVGDSVSGVLAPGTQVDLVQMALPRFDEEFLEETDEQRTAYATSLVTALADAPKAKAAVVSWDPAASTLVVSGATAEQVPVGTLVLA